MNSQPDWLRLAARDQQYHLTLLLSPDDVPWVDDGTRVLEHQRRKHFELLADELHRCGRPYHVLGGDFAQRHQRASTLIQRLLETQMSGRMG